MQTRTKAGQRNETWKRWLLSPLVALAACGGGDPPAAPPATALAASTTAVPATLATTVSTDAPTTTDASAVADVPPAPSHTKPPPTKTFYRIVHLVPGPADAVLNARGQVALTQERGDAVIAQFYDGTTVRDLGSLGGDRTLATALNDSGQVVGVSSFAPGNLDVHAFRWTLETGMIDLHASPAFFATSRASDINNRGQVAGYLPFLGPVLEPFHAVRWSPDNVPLDLGTLNGPSSAVSINEAGQVAGSTLDAAGNPVAFRWTETDGMVALGTLGGPTSSPVAINELGHVAGNSDTGRRTRAFLWTPEKGMIDLGPRKTDANSFVNALNDKDTVVGVTFVNPINRAFVWTKASGMKDLGTFGGQMAFALDVNNVDQVVGSAQIASGGFRAFVWSRAEGLVDLNTRILDAPPGFLLALATDISDNGSIVAVSDAATVLLVPAAATQAAPVVGPIKLGGTARINSPVSFHASFKDADLRDTHRATWSWGDGSKDEAGNVVEKNGAGTVRGAHTYRTAGVYTVTLTVTDSSGKSATVQRTVVVCGPHAAIVGEGLFMSPPGALAANPGHAGAATFALLADHGKDALRQPGKAILRFSTAQLRFASTRFDSVAVAGPRIQYRGSGTVNGAGRYQFMLVADTGAAGGTRLRLRIWQLDPGTNQEVVAYDNGAGAAGSGSQGAVLTEGAVTIAPRQ